MNNTMSIRLAALRRRLQPLWPWLRWGTAATLALLLVLDFAFPPPLPKQRDTSTLVVAADGTPLRAFADAEGVWRCRTTFNCTDACPRGIQVTKAIQEVKRALLFRRV